jgi:protein-S-isoprenylcysteine O-methyltransferase Ste14
MWFAGAVFTLLDAFYGYMPLNYPVGIKIGFDVLILLALILRIISYIKLGKYFTYDVRISVDHRLITGGIYSLIRHPAYLSKCILGTMPALVLGSVAGFFILSVFTVPQTIYRINREEEILENRFEDEFRRYKEKSWRLIPFIY